MEEKTVSLKWDLEIKNFTKLKEGLQFGETLENHCRLCVLSNGPICMYREICRIPQDEVYINKKISLIK